MMRSLPFWPSGLMGRIVLVLLAAILLESIGDAVLLEWRVMAGGAAPIERIAPQVAVAVRGLERTPQTRRAAFVAALSTQRLSLEWTPVALVRAEPGADSELVETSRARLAAEPDLAGRDVELHPGGVKGLDLHGRVPVQGGALTFIAPGLLTGPSPLLGEFLSTAILAGIVSLTAILFLRELGSPLRSLARTVDKIGGLSPIPVDVSGPREVREVAKTLNAMQERIARLIANRTQALAAVSHDLRTPIARMRLQADDVTDPVARAAMVESLDEMEYLVASVLTYLAGETSSEAPRSVDLAQLLMTQVSAANDAGHSVFYEGPENARVMLRPLGIKRAFNNLVGNAVTYGGATTVRLTLLAAAARVQIDDDGPGIPDADLPRVLEPFCRLDPARNAASGGVGLGLPIAVQSVAREGGSLTLANRQEGGLRAEIVLPHANS